MIKGFREETSPLSEMELRLIPVFINSLLKHIGKDNAVTSSDITKGLRNNGYGVVTGPRIRKIINHIRINNLVPCLVSCSKGYYISNDAKELEDYIESLKERCSAIMAVAEALQGQKVQYLVYNNHKQQNLFA